MKNRARWISAQRRASSGLTARAQGFGSWCHWMSSARDLVQFLAWVVGASSARCCLVPCVVSYAQSPLCPYHCPAQSRQAQNHKCWQRSVDTPTGARSLSRLSSLPSSLR